MNPRKIHQSFSKWIDAQEMAKKHPDTFEAPDLDELKRDVKIGDFVKWNIGAERLWLLVVDVDGDVITGLLSNYPLDEHYQMDDVVRIKFRHVYDYKEGDKESLERAEAFLDELVEKEKSIKRQDKAKKKTKKKPAKKRKKYETLVAKSRRLWDSYVEKPTKKGLKSMMKHLDEMEKSTSKKVKHEWRRAKRVARLEAKDLGMLIREKPKKKRKKRSK